MVADGHRPRRVAEAIREYLAMAFVRELGDPRLSGVSVTRVEVPADLSVAWVYLRPLTGGEDSRERQRLLAALGRAGGRLRRGLGPRLNMKRVPELRFKYDTGPDASRRVEELLAEIHAEQAEKDPNPDD